jgi:hypothetical protein
MTLNSPATPFTGSTITLSSGTIYAQTFFLQDVTTAGFSNLNISSGIARVGTNAIFSGQINLLSTVMLNYNSANGNRAIISSIVASNIQVNVLGGSTIMGAAFIGDGSQLSNIRLPSSTVLQAQYSFFTVNAGSSYTGAPWLSQLLNISTMAQQVAPVVLSNDGYTLNVFVSTPTVFRVNYMTGGNQNTLSVVRPTLTMSVSTATKQVFYPSVENYEGGGGSVSFLETFDSNSQILFYARGYSNYSFTSNDATLYRISFETVSGTGTNIFSTINTWTNINYFTSTVNFSNTLNSSGVANLTGTTNVANLVATNTASFQSATFQNLVTFQASTVTNALYASNDIRSVTSTIANSMYTNNLWVMCNATFGPSSITLSNNIVSASNVQISTISILDQSTMTYKVLTISSGSLYLNNTLASAGGSGSSGGLSSSNVSTISVNTGSLFLGLYFA